MDAGRLMDTVAGGAGSEKSGKSEITTGRKYCAQVGWSLKKGDVCFTDVRQNPVDFG